MCKKICFLMWLCMVVVAMTAGVGWSVVNDVNYIVEYFDYSGQQDQVIDSPSEPEVPRVMALSQLRWGALGDNSESGFARDGIFVEARNTGEGTPGNRLQIDGPANSAGNYVYTIFDTNHLDPNIVEDHSVNLTDTKAAIRVYVQNWNIDSPTIQYMIRDAAGDWFKSYGSQAITTPGIWDWVNPASKSWDVIDETAMDDILDALAPGDENDITLGGVGSPDFSAITGGGIYIKYGSQGATDDPPDPHPIIIDTIVWWDGLASIDLKPVCTAGGPNEVHPWDSGGGSEYDGHIVYLSDEDDDYGITSRLWTVAETPNDPIGDPCHTKVNFDDDTSLTPHVTFPGGEGEYQLRLTVTDTNGNESNDLVIIMVNDNFLPVVEANLSQVLVLADADTAQLHGYYSDDGEVNGFTPTTVWSCIEKPNDLAKASFDNSTILEPTVTFDHNYYGTYVFQLDVNDGEFTVYDRTTVFVLKQAGLIKTLTPTDDTIRREDKATKIWGSAPAMKLKYGPIGKRQDGIMKWDLGVDVLGPMLFADLTIRTANVGGDNPDNFATPEDPTGTHIYDAYITQVFDANVGVAGPMSAGGAWNEEEAHWDNTRYLDYSYKVDDEEACLDQIIWLNPRTLYSFDVLDANWYESSTPTLVILSETDYRGNRMIQTKEDLDPDYIFPPTLLVVWDPNMASNERPEDGSIGVPKDVNMSWTAGINASNALIYFGTDEEEVRLATGPSSPAYKGMDGDGGNGTYDPPNDLVYDAKYYWRIDSNDTGNDGWVWSFSTKSTKPILIDPEDDDGNMVELPVEVSFVPSVAATSHDLYISTDWNDVNDFVDANALWVTDVTSPYDVQNLDYNEVYYVRIKAINPMPYTDRGSEIHAIWTDANESLDHRFQEDVSNWTTSGGAEISIGPSAFSKKLNKELVFDFNDPCGLSEITIDFTKGGTRASYDWSEAMDRKAMIVPYKGHEDNPVITCSITLTDTNDNAATLTKGGDYFAPRYQWRSFGDWDIDLTEFDANNASFDRGFVKSMTIALSDGDGNESGTMSFCDVQIVPSRCQGHNAADLDSSSRHDRFIDSETECTGEANDLAKLARVWLDKEREVLEDVGFGGGVFDPNLEAWFMFEENQGSIVDSKSGYVALAFYDEPMPEPPPGTEGMFYSQPGYSGDSINCNGILGGWFELQNTVTLFNKLRNGFTTSVWLYGDEPVYKALGDGQFEAGQYVFEATPFEDIEASAATNWWEFEHIKFYLSPTNPGSITSGAIKGDIWEEVGTSDQKYVTKADYVGSIGGWNHWAMVFDPANDFHGIYVNGLLVDRNMDPRKQGPWPLGGVTNCTICAKQSGNWPDRRWPWNGRIDELRFYSRPLTQGEILNLAGVASVVQPVLHSDINKDNVVDFGDFSWLALMWGDDPCDHFWPGGENENPVPPPPPPPPPNEVTLSFDANEDTHVQENNAAVNYGDSTTLKVRGSGTGKEFIGYLKFNVSGVVGPITSAKLKVYTAIGSGDVVDVKAVADTTWDEMTMTYLNKPATGDILDSNATPDAEWAEWDVTDYITEDGTYSFALTKVAVDTGQQHSSSESIDANYVPVLEVTSQPPPLAEVSIGASEDTHVQENNAAVNYGDSLTLKVRGAGTGKEFIGYLKFDVADIGTVASAKLRAYTAIGSGDVVDVKAVADTTWDEMTMTYLNKPAPGAILDSNATPNAEWAEWDVTEHITGNGTYSLALTKVAVDTGQQHNSRENAENNPVLVITYYPLVEHVDSIGASEDTHVQENNAAVNYGDSLTMKVRGPTTGKEFIGFLKFDVADLGTITSAKLKAYTAIGSGDVVDVKAVADTTWDEMTMTYLNKPATGAILDSQATPDAAWAEWDVTSHITGDGTYSLALTKVATATGQQHNSRENVADNPVLEVTHLKVN